MTAAVAPLAHQVAVRAQKDTRFAKVLDALLTAPTTPQGTLERIAARKLSDQRRAALVEDFVDGSIRTCRSEDGYDFGVAGSDSVEPLATGQP